MDIGAVAHPHGTRSVVTAGVLTTPPQTSTARIVTQGPLPPTQGTILGLVEESPGITIRQVAIVLRVSHTTASYHLQALSALGLIQPLRDGREVRHFMLTSESSRDSHLHALMRDSRAGHLVRFICSNPVERMTISSVARQAGMPFGFVRRTLLKLQDMHLVTLARGHYRYTLKVQAHLRTLVERNSIHPV